MGFGSLAIPLRSIALTDPATRVGQAFTPAWGVCGARVVGFLSVLCVHLRASLALSETIPIEKTETKPTIEPTTSGYEPICPASPTRRNARNARSEAVFSSHCFALLPLPSDLLARDGRAIEDRDHTARATFQVFASLSTECQQPCQPGDRGLPPRGRAAQNA